MNVFDDAYKNRPFLFGKAATEELMFVIDKFNIKGKSLELGCGDGRDTFHVVKRGLHVTAVDQSASAITTLTERSDFSKEDRMNLELMCANVTNLEVAEKKFDFVYAITLFDHLSAADGEVLLNKVWASLKDDGYLFIKVHTVDDVGNTKSSAAVSEFATEIKHFYSHEELLNRMNRFGSICFYLEASELDLDHGTPHTHAFASILLRKDK